MATDSLPQGPLLTGKVPPQLLAQLLDSLGADAPDDLILGPGIGHDAAVVAAAGPNGEDSYFVLASDPITLGGHRPGWHAVHVNANDVACLGADPRWFLLTVLAPPGTDATELDALLRDVTNACREIGATLVGGHTEITDAVQRLVLSGTMIGVFPAPGGAERLIRSDGARRGDALIQIGPIAIEGTALLASDAESRLSAAGLTDAELAVARDLLRDPGISVLPAAGAVRALPGLHALHDPTEGGLATAALELAEAAGLSIELQAGAILRHPLTDRVAAALDLDPLGLLASGALLAAVHAEHAPDLLRQLDNAGAQAAQIGSLRASNQPAILVANGATRPLPRFERDELVRVLAP